METKFIKQSEVDKVIDALRDLAHRFVELAETQGNELMGPKEAPDFWKSQSQASELFCIADRLSEGGGFWIDPNPDHAREFLQNH